MPRPEGNFIDGRRVAARSGAVYDRPNPSAPAEILDRWPDSEERDVVSAIAAGRRGFEEWRRIPSADRAEILLQAAIALDAAADVLIPAFSADLAVNSDLARVEYDAARRLARIMGTAALRVHTSGIEPSQIVSHRRRPLGVVGIAPGWSDPMSALAVQLAAALGGGCAAIVFAPREAANTVDRMLSIYTEAGIPHGVLNWIHGSPAVLLSALMRHPDVGAVSINRDHGVGGELSGSQETGLRVNAERPTANGMIVMDDADLDAAVEDAVSGAFGFAGQRRDAVTRIVTHRKIASVFERRLVEAARGLRLGGPGLAGAQIGPLVSEVLVDETGAAVSDAVTQGASLLSGGVRAGGPLEAGWYFEPTVLTGVRSSFSIVREPVPGPVVSLLTVDSYEEAILVLNDVLHALTASIYTRDADRAVRAAGEMNAAAVAINGPAGPNEGLRSARAIDTFTDLQTVTLRRSGQRGHPSP